MLITILLFTGLVYSLVATILSIIKSKAGKAFELTPWLNPLGAFVWGDGVVFGFFWFLVLFYVLYTRDYLIFWLTLSVFWLVRSLGETIYWFNQQFSPIRRNPPENMWLFTLFKNDSIWFIYQIFWQCVLVISIITSVKLFSLWI